MKGLLNYPPTRELSYGLRLSMPPHPDRPLAVTQDTVAIALPAAEAR
jgi:hypothetical protein